MPYQDSAINGNRRIRETLGDGFTPDFDEHFLKQAERLEIWCSSFTDPGPDYSEFKLFDTQNNLIASKTKTGF